MSFTFFRVLSNKINNSLNSRSTAPFLEGIDKFPLSKINLFVFSSCEEPKTSFEFKMKSEFWPKMMYPEFLYNPDTYLKNHPNNLIFRSKYKNVDKMTDFKIFKISLPIKIYPQIYKIRPEVKENPEFYPFFIN